MVARIGGSPPVNARPLNARSLENILRKEGGVKGVENNARSSASAPPGQRHERTLATIRRRTSAPPRRRRHQKSEAGSNDNFPPCDHNSIACRQPAPDPGRR